MIERLTLLALLSGCGRLGFDDRAPDDGDVTRDVVAVGHDEDGDGIADAIDVCPHLGDDQADGDGDEIGDACDPRPTTPGDRLVLFATLQPGDQPFSFPTNVWTAEADGVRLDNSDFGDLVLDLGSPAGDGRIVVGLDITALRLPAATQRQLSLHAVGDLDAAQQFGELNALPGNEIASVTQYTPPATYAPTAFMQLANSVHTGAVTLSSTQLNGTLTFDGGWPGEMYTASAPNTANAERRFVYLTFNRVDLFVRYIWIISS